VQADAPISPGLRIEEGSQEQDGASAARHVGAAAARGATNAVATERSTGTILAGLALVF
jgi:hypothetical protein